MTMISIPFLSGDADPTSSIYTDSHNETGQSLTRTLYHYLPQLMRDVEKPPPALQIAGDVPHQWLIQSSLESSGLNCVKVLCFRPPFGSLFAASHARHGKQQFITVQCEIEVLLQGPFWASARCQRDPRWAFLC